MHLLNYFSQEISIHDPLRMASRPIGWGTLQKTLTPKLRLEQTNATDVSVSAIMPAFDATSRCVWSYVGELRMAEIWNPNCIVVKIFWSRNDEEENKWEECRNKYKDVKELELGEEGEWKTQKMNINLEMKKVTKRRTHIRILIYILAMLRRLWKLLYCHV